MVRPLQDYPSRLPLPERVFLTRKFNPTYCTCGKQCTHEPQYHMERTVFRTDSTPRMASESDLVESLKLKIDAARFIVASIWVDGEDESTIVHSEKVRFIRNLTAALKNEDLSRLLDHFKREGIITLTGFDGSFLCQKRENADKQKNTATPPQMVKELYTVSKSLSKNAEIEHVEKTKASNANLAFHKDISEIVHAYEVEILEIKEEANSADVDNTSAEYFGPDCTIPHQAQNAGTRKNDGRYEVDTNLARFRYVYERSVDMETERHVFSSATNIPDEDRKKMPKEQTGLIEHETVARHALLYDLSGLVKCYEDDVFEVADAYERKEAVDTDDILHEKQIDHAVKSDGGAFGIWFDDTHLDDFEGIAQAYEKVLIDFVDTYENKETDEMEETGAFGIWMEDTQLDDLEEIAQAYEDELIDVVDRKEIDEVVDILYEEQFGLTDSNESVRPCMWVEEKRLDELAKITKAYEEEVCEVEDAYESKETDDTEDSLYENSIHCAETNGRENSDPLEDTILADTAGIIKAYEDELFRAHGVYKRKEIRDVGDSLDEKKLCYDEALDTLLEDKHVNVDLNDEVKVKENDLFEVAHMFEGKEIDDIRNISYKESSTDKTDKETDHKMEEQPDTLADLGRRDLAVTNEDNQATCSLPQIATYNDDYDGVISPAFGILAVYCESEIHVSWER